MGRKKTIKRETTSDYINSLGKKALAGTGVSVPKRVRCERDGKVWNPVVSKSRIGEVWITCPRCGRRYYLKNGKWLSDRPLTILE